MPGAGHIPYFSRKLVFNLSPKMSDDLYSFTVIFFTKLGHWMPTSGWMPGVVAPSAPHLHATAIIIVEEGISKSSRLLREEINTFLEFKPKRQLKS